MKGGSIIKTLELEKVAKEKRYKRNFATYMLEGFLFSFSLSIFSHTTVLPIYVSNLSNNEFYIGLISLIFFSFSSLSMLFSSVIAANSSKTKLVTITIAFIQRIGLALIYSSVFWVSKSNELALLVFFMSYMFYAFSAGMTGPVFSNLISEVIDRKLASFYGSYMFAGSLSGFIGSFVVNKFLLKYSFPDNFNYLFLMGLISALLATIVLYVGIVEDDNKQNKLQIKFSELPSKFKTILTKNDEYRYFIILKSLMSAAEVAVPFYIIKVSYLANVDSSITGSMNAVLLLTTLITSRLLGEIGNKKGVIFLIRLGAIAGVVATSIALVLPNYISAIFIFIAIAIFTNSMMISTNVSNIELSKANEVPIYTALTGIIVAPVYASFALIGSYISKNTSINSVFIISLLIYILILLILRRMDNKNIKEF